MRYLLLIGSDEPEPDGITPEVRVHGGQAIDVNADPWVEEMTERGVRLFGSRVRPPSDATTVRVRGDEVLLVDGPFAETKEWMAGFDVIECANLDEAIEVAAKHPAARHAMIEVRPFWSD